VGMILPVKLLGILVSVLVLLVLLVFLVLLVLLVLVLILLILLILLQRPLALVGRTTHLGIDA